MRVFVISIMLIITNVLQSTYFQHFRIRGTIPNFYIMIIVSFALLRGSREGAIVGFFAGLIQDLYFGTSIGFYALLGMYTGYFCGKINKDFYRESFLLPLVMTIFSTFFYELTVYVFTYLIRGKLQFLYYLNNVILPEVVYTGIISIFVYQCIYYLNKKLELKEKKNRNLFK
ncbi:MAG: rod shape-determining protein MreD [Epulopiscium sp.]|uniref:Rod shape-determining protein MreD n=1 Tax=Defluviitalea raffinosedens TaxID=1450156 RepID=A0A7C8LUY1_9FIRM|nr:rod shape-determining protein MreD [Defluviitalea raffinosedens]KAE9637306.1 rod shape-determining protein MreD [Defluviitalea raffinosedens]MBM7685611.1 rod shape-determining protein MreD [Defluviitalea raffinosedens]MDK2788536.1 rod shape-determining protein MreD [Candidatus Epulonipiscium sp.]HHW66660.1 rod shape-determining protein MreD [Candidatus Epulonipiscium sp.]